MNVTMRKTVFSALNEKEVNNRSRFNPQEKFKSNVRFFILEKHYIFEFSYGIGFFIF